MCVHVIEFSVIDAMNLQYTQFLLLYSDPILMMLRCGWRDDGFINKLILRQPFSHFVCVCGFFHSLA